MIRWDGGGTGGGRAGAAEIAWEEARDGGGRSKGMIWWDGGGTGGGTGGGRAGAAEIAWKVPASQRKNERKLAFGTFQTIPS